MLEQPPRHQAGQECARRNRAGHDSGHPGGSPPAPPAVFALAPEHHRDHAENGQLDHDEDGEEPSPRAAVDLRGGVLADQGADRGRQAAPGRPLHRRADRPGGNGLPTPAQHGRGEVSELTQAGLAGGGSVEQSGGVSGAFDDDQPQMRGAVVARRENRRDRPGWQVRDDPAQRPVIRPDRGRPDRGRAGSGRCRNRGEAHDRQRAPRE